LAEKKNIDCAYILRNNNERKKSTTPFVVFSVREINNKKKRIEIVCKKMLKKIYKKNGIKNNKITK